MMRLRIVFGRRCCMTAKRGALAGIMLRPVIAEKEQNSEVVPVKVPIVEAPVLIQ